MKKDDDFNQDLFSMNYILHYDILILINRKG
jgi:hypothetical protein